MSYVELSRFKVLNTEIDDLLPVDDNWVQGLPNTWACLGKSISAKIRIYTKLRVFRVDTSNAYISVSIIA